MYGRVNEENTPGEHTISPTDGGKQESLVDVMHAFDSDEEPKSVAEVPALPRVASFVERIAHHFPIVSPRSGVWNCPKNNQELDTMLASFMCSGASAPLNSRLSICSHLECPSGFSH